MASAADLLKGPSLRLLVASGFRADCRVVLDWTCSASRPKLTVVNSGVHRCLFTLFINACVCEMEITCMRACTSEEGSPVDDVSPPPLPQGRAQTLRPQLECGDESLLSWTQIATPRVGRAQNEKKKKHRRICKTGPELSADGWVDSVKALWAHVTSFDLLCKVKFARRVSATARGIDSVPSRIVVCSRGKAPTPTIGGVLWLAEVARMA